MTNPKPACFKEYDKVVLFGKEGVVLKIEGDFALVHSPDFKPEEPYIVIALDLLMPSPIKSWSC